MFLVNGVKIEQEHFGDGALKLKFNDFLKSNHIVWKYENDAELFTLICLKRHLDENNPHSVSASTTLTMNYLPHARQDRVQDIESVFTLKYFCEVINSLHFTYVEVLDAHSNVGVALLNNCANGLPLTQIMDAIDSEGGDDVVLFFPDEGAMKRYQPYFFNLKYAFGIKRRNWGTGRIESLDLVYSENVRDKNVLIIDDICSYGNTFVRAAKALRDAGAKRVALYVTHAENNIIKGDVFQNIDQVYTTTSLVHTDEVKEKVRYV